MLKLVYVTFERIQDMTPKVNPVFNPRFTSYASFGIYPLTAPLSLGYRGNEKQGCDMTRDKSTTIEILKEIIIRDITRHPCNKALLEAFQPVFIERNRIREDLQLEKMQTFILDEDRFRGGVPLCGQHSLFHQNDPWQEILLAMIPAVKAGFPTLQEDMNRLAEAVQGAKVNVYDFFRVGQNAKERTMQAWSETIAIRTSGIVLILHQVARIVLEKRTEALDKDRIQSLWTKGYCPICGTYPSLGVIKEKIGERLLHCSCCGYDWRFSRVICPYCEFEGQQGMNFFFIEDREQESAYTCDHCKRYLITLQKMSDLNERDLDVSALGLVHLDVLMQEKDFSPMAATDWNTFR